MAHNRAGRSRRLQKNRNSINRPTGDETQVNSAIQLVEFGQPLNTSTTSILATQLTTDPLAAPLASLNNEIANVLKSVFASPALLFVLALTLFFLFGGGAFIKRKLGGL